MNRRAAVLVMLGLALVASITVATVGTQPPTTTSSRPAAVPVRVDGHGVRWWAGRARANRAAARWQHQRAGRLEQLLRRRIVEPRQSVYEHSATLAAIAYGVDAATLIRKGRCESARWTRFLNTASGAAGPWQFLASTWATTPYAAFSPYDPLAAALAAAWMHGAGRGKEWSCH